MLAGGGVKTRRGEHLVYIANISCFFFFQKGGLYLISFCRLALSLKVMLHETIRNDDL